MDMLKIKKNSQMTIITDSDLNGRKNTPANSKKDMLEPDWNTIKLKAINNCSKCNSKRSYTNPLEKCFECRKKFCFGCLWGCQFKEAMKENEECRSICDKCKKKHQYI